MGVDCASVGASWNPDEVLAFFFLPFLVAADFSAAFSCCNCFVWSFERSFYVADFERAGVAELPPAAFSLLFDAFFDDLSAGVTSLRKFIYELLAKRDLLHLMNWSSFDLSFFMLLVCIL